MIRIIATTLLTSLVSLPILAEALPRGTPRIYKGLCDASAAIRLSNDLFVVADDEENLLRVYSVANPGDPVALAPLIPVDEVTTKKKKKKSKKGKKEKDAESDLNHPPVMYDQPISMDTSDFIKAVRKMPELDLEGAARFGDTILWIGSHGRNASGEEDLNRRKILFSSIKADPILPRLAPVAAPYTELLSHLARDPLLTALQLGNAALLAPKERGGLNIEGLTAWKNQEALIGLRGPLHLGSAVLIPLLNPLELPAGATPRFAKPILLDLGGRGIKDIVPWKTGYLIAAGDPKSPARGALYEWRPGQSGNPPKFLLDLEHSGINVEGLLPIAERGSVMLLSDDGNEIIEEKQCKKIKDSQSRRFRTVEIPLP